MIDKIYERLAAGFPVPVELAAVDLRKDVMDWTLHYALVTKLDVAKDTITLANPYGYEEEYSIEEFLSAMRFELDPDMPFYLKLGFFAELFHRNVLYSIE